MIITFLHIKDYSESNKSFLKQYTFLNVISAFALSFSMIVYLLHLIDTLGYTSAGFVLGATVILQFAFDYPTGSLSDYIGQKWVLFTAFLSLTLGYGLLYFGDSSEIFFVSAILMGFGFAQNSGALESWFDTKYQQEVVEEDDDRKKYGFITSRISTLTSISRMVSFTLGTIFSSFISRQSVFLVQACLLFLCCVLFLKYLTKTVKLDKSKVKSNYFTFFKGGFEFFLSSKKVFFLIIGVILLNLQFTFYNNLVSVPLFRLYTGSDYLVGILNMAISVSGIIISIKLANISSKIKAKRYPYFFAFGIILLYPFYIIIFLLNPPFSDSSLNIVGIISLFAITLVSSSIILYLGIILLNRIIIDIVPSKNRNAVYSLIPSFDAFLSIFTLPFGGILIDSFGLIAGMEFNLLLALLAPIAFFLSNYFMKDSKLNSIKQNDLITSVN